MRIWHYTIGERLKPIIESGRINLATANVPEHERAAAWFSSNVRYEPTAQKLLELDGVNHVMTEKQTAQRGRGLVRIEVASDAAPLTWKEFKRQSGIKLRDIKHVEKRARDLHAHPGQWYASFEPVGADSWLAIEVWDGTTWLPLAEDAGDVESYAVTDKPQPGDVLVVALADGTMRLLTVGGLDIEGVSAKIQAGEAEALCAVRITRATTHIN